MYGDDDLDSVLLGGDIGPDGGDFDPFATGDGTDDGDVDTAIIYDRSDAFGGFVGGGIQGDSGQPANDDGPLFRSRADHPSSAALREQREREAVDTGIGNVGRVAADRSGHTSEGVARRERSEGVANSLFDAQQRVRADIARSDDDRIKRHYERQSITAPPQFESTSFEATIAKLQANATGDWIITLKVPSANRAEATVLGDSYGLALQVTIERKRFSIGDD